MKVTLKVWRQKNAQTSGGFKTYTSPALNENMSFLEMLDVVNEELANQGEEPIAFDHDCREGICGTCSLMIDGQAHGPQRGTATCQLHMRKFTSGDTITIEPWRATAFPIIKDLMCDRSAFDRIVESGGFITAPTGGAPDANLIPIAKPVARTFALPIPRRRWWHWARRRARAAKTSPLRYGSRVDWRCPPASRSSKVPGSTVRDPASGPYQDP
mgnify:CR=1 FL=1